MVIEDGTIARLGAATNPDRVIDASGLTVLPGGVDLHVHFRDMAQSEKETWATGSRAAAAGGVTCVVDQPNTDPPTTDLPGLRRKREAAGDSVVDYCLNGALTPDADLDGLAPEVAAFGETFTAGGDLYVGDLERGLRRAAALDRLVTIHAEDREMVRRGLERERGGPPESWADARPPEAEVEGVESAVAALDSAGTDAHFCHVSTPRGADIATSAGHTAEATPHHLLLDREALAEHGARAKCNPPLRSEEDRAGLWHRFLDGDLVVATDHAPHRKDGDDFWDAPPGIPGVQTMLPLLLATDAPIPRVVDACCTRPAEILGLPKGRVAPGYDADLALYALDDPGTVDPDRLHTKAGYSLFEGRDAFFPEATLIRGRVAHRDGEFSGTGRMYRGVDLRR